MGESVSGIQIVKRAPALENEVDPDHEVLGRLERAIRNTQGGINLPEDKEHIRQGALRLLRLWARCACEVKEWQESVAIVFPDADISIRLAAQRLRSITNRLKKLSHSLKPADENERLAQFAAHLQRVLLEAGKRRTSD